VAPLCRRDRLIIVVMVTQRYRRCRLFFPPQAIRPRVNPLVR